MIMSQINIQFLVYYISSTLRTLGIMDRNILEYEDEYTGLSSNRILYELDISDHHHHGIPHHPETELMPIFKHIRVVLIICISIIIAIILYWL